MKVKWEEIKVTIKKIMLIWKPLQLIPCITKNREPIEFSFLLTSAHFTWNA